MIWLIGGTSESRSIVRELTVLGYEVFVTTTTNEGANLVKDCGVEIGIGRLSIEEMKRLVVTRGIQLVVDASHPYATVVSQNALEVCTSQQLPYVRFERPEQRIPAHSLVKVVDDMPEAATLAFRLGQTVFTTIGIKDLPIFTEELFKQRGQGQEQLRLITKVLPMVSSIRSCQELGLELGDIFAVSGAFSASLYQELIREYAIQVMVSKESGEAGGVPEKISACLGTHIPLIIVRRPRLEYPTMVHEIGGLLKTVQLQLRHMDLESR